MADTDTVPFSELFAVPLRNGLTRPKAVRGQGVKMVNMGEIFAHDRIRSVSMDRVPIDEHERGSYLLELGDLLFARQSLVLAGAGKCSVLLEADQPATFESHIIRARLDKKIADPLFYFYFFESRTGRNVIESIVEQVAAAGIRGSDLANVEVPKPPLGKQRAIAHILGTLDDKIELNRRMNETLEAIARALFRSWFVDFDPVRAKADGRDPGLPKHLADLFPESFEDSELGQIPNGWTVGTVDEEFNLTMGQSPPGDTYNEAGDGLPFFQGRADFGFRFPTKRVYCVAPTRFAEKGDTLVSVRAPVGDINMATERCCIGRGVAAVRHKTGARCYTYYSMRSLEEAFASFEAEGTVFGSIGKKDFHGLACVTPSSEAVAVFERVVEALDGRLHTNGEESRTLAALRDTLLPKLISGELRVNGAEQLPEPQP